MFFRIKTAVYGNWFYMYFVVYFVDLDDLYTTPRTRFNINFGFDAFSHCFFEGFMHSQWEALCVYVFNRRWKVFIFSRFSTCRRRIACVFSYFLAVG